MLGHAVGALWVGALLLWTVEARAQCTKDTDCKGDRVCEEGSCVAGLPPAPPPPPDSQVSAAEIPVPATPAPAPPSQAAAPAEPQKRKRHSTGMRVTGIVMVSVAPIALVAGLASAIAKVNCETRYSPYDDPQPEDNSWGSKQYRDCDQYDAQVGGFVLLGLGLVGAGVPLIVIGAKREPVNQATTATLKPWVTPFGGGAELGVSF